MEGKEKTFGELNKGDTIYFFFKDFYKGPHEIREYVLENEPLGSCCDGIIELDINLTGNYLYDCLEFSADDVEETLNLADFNYNCLLYGDEYWYFTTSKEMAIRKRKEMLEAYIFRTEANLIELKTKLENHLKEYGDIEF